MTVKTEPEFDGAAAIRPLIVWSSLSLPCSGVDDVDAAS